MVMTVSREVRIEGPPARYGAAHSHQWDAAWSASAGRGATAPRSVAARSIGTRGLILHLGVGLLRLRIVHGASRKSSYGRAAARGGHGHGPAPVGAGGGRRSGATGPGRARHRRGGRSSHARSGDVPTDGADGLA